MTQDLYPRLIFPYGFDKRDEFEAPQKGRYGPAVFELSESKRFVVNFYDPVLFQYLIEADKCCSPPWFSEPGLIILQEVTEENMRMAVKKLAEDGFFDYLAPLDDLLFKRLFPLLKK